MRKSLSDKNILVCDDNDMVREYLSEVLVIEGANVFEAKDGHQALNLLERYGFDVVLLDLDMPVLGGMEVLKEMRENHQHIAVVILTGIVGGNFAIEAAKLGVSKFLQKPLGPSKIVFHIKNAIFSNANNF